METDVLAQREGCLGWDVCLKLKQGFEGIQSGTVRCHTAAENFLMRGALRRQRCVFLVRRP